MKKSEIVKLATLIAKIDNNQTLSTVINLVKDQQKNIRATANMLVKASLCVGDKVKVNSKRITELGEVVKINRTKAEVRIDGKVWNCPLSMLEVV
jgi:hypothetical protein